MTANATVQEIAGREYQYGFVTDLETDAAPHGLSEDVIRLISAKKNEPDWLLEWRLRAYRHWLTDAPSRTGRTSTTGPSTTRTSSTTRPRSPRAGPKSLDEVDPELRAMFDKLGISLAEQERLSGVAVDAIVDSVSVATTFKKKLAEVGVIFCSFSEAVQDHPDLVRQVPRLGRPLPGQLLRHAQLRGLHRRLVLLRPQGRALPDGAVHLLPHQRRKHRPVRADAASSPKRART